MSETKERVVWIDVYKALAICLVVIGHATGLFNHYIYQFHLAAFFCVSGYVARQRNEDFFKIILKKFYTIILPLVMFVLLNVGLMAVLNSLGLYEFWFGEYQYIGAVNILKNFFCYGSLYTWWLGAAWFLIVLFFVLLISKVMYILANQNNLIYMIYSILLYVLGYYYINNIGINLPYYFDLVFIAQFFYCVGYILKEQFNSKLVGLKWKVSALLFVCTFAIMYICGGVPNITIDYGARSFNNIFLNTLTSLNGIIFLYSFSQMLSKIKNKKVLKFFDLIGQNTLGIVLLHFVFFKISYIILYYANVISYQDIALITPKYNVGAKYWWLISGTSIFFSVLVWILMKKSKVIALLLGVDKINYSRFEKWIKSKKGIQFYVENKIKLYHKILYLRSRIAIVLVIIGLMFLGGIFVRTLYIRNTSIDIEFPCYYNNVVFNEGWLPQSDETYRWIESKGVAIIDTSCNDKITIEGYVPETFIEVDLLEVFINGRLIGTIDVKNMPNFSVEYDIKGMNTENKINVEFVFDDVHVPSVDDLDQRRMSGMIKSITIK